MAAGRQNQELVALTGIQDQQCFACAYWLPNTKEIGKNKDVKKAIKLGFARLLDSRIEFYQPIAHYYY